MRNGRLALLIYQAPKWKGSKNAFAIKRGNYPISKNTLKNVLDLREAVMRPTAGGTYSIVEI